MTLKWLLCMGTAVFTVLTVRFLGTTEEKPLKRTRLNSQCEISILMHGFLP